jgi:hypothetical protein
VSASPRPACLPDRRRADLTLAVRTHAGRRGEFRTKADYDIRASELVGRGLGNSATARRLAERKDADSIVRDLVMSALAHGPTVSVLRHALLALPARARDTLRSRSDALLAELLVHPHSASRLAPALRSAGQRQAPASPLRVTVPALTGPRPL